MQNSVGCSFRRSAASKQPPWTLFSHFSLSGHGRQYVSYGSRHFRACPQVVSHTHRMSIKRCKITSARRAGGQRNILSSRLISRAKNMLLTRLRPRTRGWLPAG
ncbi:hypothetical protein HC256_010450 [Beauveria bassiana]|nr:hypothetical protein HC256_010450 [Beauveria bassiana]